jgi:diguanylate cyclase (GGDEF)-like protein
MRSKSSFARKTPSPPLHETCQKARLLTEGFASADFLTYKYSAIPPFCGILITYILKKEGEFMHSIKKLLVLLFFTAVLCIAGIISVAADSENSHVLFISSYSPDYFIYNDQIEGVKNAFKNEDINLDIEFMYSKRFGNEENEDYFYEWLTYKLAQLDYTYDAVIVADDNALDFVTACQDEFFYETPIIPLGINSSERAEAAAEDPWITNGAQLSSMEETIKISTRFQPDAVNVVAIVDNTTTGQGYKEQFYETATAFPDMNFMDIDLSEYSFEEAELELSQLNEDNIVMFLSDFSDKNMNTFTYDEGVSYVVENCSQPIYHLNSSGLGDGIIGGMMNNHIEQGYVAAEIVLQILDGKDIDDISLNVSNTNEYMFDMDIINAFNIDEALIPEDAILINNEPGFWDIYGDVILLVSLIILAELALIIGLFINIRKRKKTENSLIENQKELIMLNENLAESNLKLSDSLDEISLKNELLYDLTHKDQLTGLNNRLSIFQYFDEALEENDLSWSTAALFMDIDNFKDINDTYGHDTGDEILQVVGSKLQAFENENTKVSRFGGDEFLILMDRQTNRDDIAEFSQKICEELSKKIVIEDLQIFLTVSLGISMYPQNCKHRISLIKQADIALYDAKDAGRNRFAFYSDDLDELLADKLSFRTEVKKAIKEKEFYFNYQPYFSARTAKIAGLEALIRWRSEKYGLVSPFKLIQTIEEMGLMFEVGNDIVHQVCLFSLELNENRDEKIRISINISAIQLMNKNFYKGIVSIFEETGASPEDFILEMTETVLIHSFEREAKIIQQLKDYGFTIALDDFGTGYSSLRYLRELPVSILKIDKSFIDFIDTSIYDSGLINAMINIAHLKGIYVVSEGVETESQLKILKKYNCDAIQGYIYSKPLPGSQVEEFLKTYKDQ